MLWQGSHPAHGGGHGAELGHSRASFGENSELSLWDEGILAWRQLLTRGGVQGGLLSFDCFVDMSFDLADAHVLFAHGPVQAGRTLPVRMEAYFRFISSTLVKAIFVAHPPTPQPTPGSPGLPAAQSSPATVPLRLRHSFPAADAHVAAVMQKLSHLRSAIASQNAGVVSRWSCAKAFRALRRIIGLTEGALNCSQLHDALRKMGYKSKGYEGLMFGHLRASREASGEEALHASKQADTEEALCFLR